MSINDQVAINVMGWRKVKDKKYIDLWLWKKDGRVVSSASTWDPEKNISDAIQALEEARKQGVELGILATKESYYVHVRVGLDNYEGDVVNFDQLPRIICEMILKAIDDNPTQYKYISESRNQNN